MSVQRSAQDLFEYIAEVYSIDLPVIRDVMRYGDERWWQAELVSSRFCKIKSFDDDSDTQLDSENTGGAWLSVYKSACDPPPPLPESLDFSNFHLRHSLRSEMAGAMLAIAPPITTPISASDTNPPNA